MPFSILSGAGVIARTNGVSTTVPVCIAPSAGDLYWALKTVGVEGFAVTVNLGRNPGSSIVQAGQVSVTTTLKDVYDFNYDDGQFPALAATVQAGFGSLGSAGHVYRVEFNYEDTLVPDVAGIQYHYSWDI